MRLIIEEVKLVSERNGKVSWFFCDVKFFYASNFQLHLQHPQVIDPSELLRPEAEFAGKCLTKFRDYSVDVNDPLKERVRQTYRQMHLNQTVDFVESKYDYKPSKNTLKCQQKR